MSVPKRIRGARDTVAGMLQEAFPKLRVSLTPEERELGIYLRGNDGLLASLRKLFESRIGRRASQPVPSDPLMCKAFMERDAELRFIMNRLEFVHISPVAQPAEDSEQPA